ncbi:uracil-DNA glycosylase [uncultured Sulfurimonas sp.]|uniref:uracil-DNA glycosylase n=1 Tax=Sulfurimonas sp. TaxID=2022749 RepID=UPI0032B198F2
MCIFNIFGDVMFLSDDWKRFLNIDDDYFIVLETLLNEEYSKKVVYPKYENIFKAFNLQVPKKIKVVIVGQDPYHGYGQADGMAFSVSSTQKVPPSLKNIYKELVSDIDCLYPMNGSLEKWGNEGVLLMNTVLTVVEGEPNSHKNIGWEDFTDSVIKSLSNELENIIYILWGGNAQKKELLIDSSKHLILKSPHPSPLSSYRGFFGSKPFSKVNSYLKKNSIKEIDWCLSAEQTLL